MKQKKRPISIYTRLTKYAAGGSISSLIDITIFLFLVEVLGIFYAVSAGISFTTAYIFYYFLNRNWIFKETKTKIGKAFFIFISYAALAVLLTIAFIYFFTDIIGFHYFISRIITLLIVGLISFTFHYNFTFQMRANKNKN